MHKRLVVLLIVLVASLLAACQSGGSSTADPAAVMDAYTTAINAGDVEAALALVADDAVYDRPGGTYNGKEEIRGFVQDLVDRHVHVELVGERTVNGDTVTWVSHVTIDDPANPGTRLDLTNNSESVIQNGLIVHHQARRP